MNRSGDRSAEKADVAARSDRLQSTERNAIAPVADPQWAGVGNKALDPLVETVRGSWRTFRMYDRSLRPTDRYVVTNRAKRYLLGKAEGSLEDMVIIVPRPILSQRQYEAYDVPLPTLSPRLSRATAGLSGGQGKRREKTTAYEQLEGG